MKREEILPIKLDSQRTIYASVVHLGGEEYVSSRIPLFGEVTSAIEGISTQIAEVLQKAKPQKATVEFGIQISMKSGKLTGLLVDAKGDASMKITLHWENNN